MTEGEAKDILVREQVRRMEDRLQRQYVELLGAYQFFKYRRNPTPADLECLAHINDLCCRRSHQVHLLSCYAWDHFERTI